MNDATYFPEPFVSPRPLQSGLDLPHHEGLKAHRLVLPQCESCGTWTWPPDVICWKCHTFGLAWNPVEPRGRIYSWTRVWHAARPELTSSLPYIVVLVELPHADGARLIGNLLGPGDQTVTCGTPVAGVFEDSPHGDHTLLQWAVADESGMPVA